MQAPLHKLGISTLNEMQREAGAALRTGADVVLRSPTGTGKTLAFLLPLLEGLRADVDEIQALVLAPTRELAQQIEQVARTLASGHKVNAVYGGRAGSLDKLDLRRRPALLIGTPGRVADRFRRDDYPLRHIRTLVLDEYDKSLKIGFAADMAAIVRQLPGLRQRVLTSATGDAEVPDFVALREPLHLDYLGRRSSRLRMVKLVTPERDKLDALVAALRHVGPEPGIVFCNFKDALGRISTHLTRAGLTHETFHGGLEQVDRERALVKFRNGSARLLLATDLAARGLDVPALGFILHYHLPPHEREFTHRNGRTARMHDEGVAYLLCSSQETPPDYVAELGLEDVDVGRLSASAKPAAPAWRTLYITAGRRDKVSRGDVAGFLMKRGGLRREQVGLIEVQAAGAYAAVAAAEAERVAAATDGGRLKRGKVRVRVG